MGEVVVEEEGGDGELMEEEGGDASILVSRVFLV